MQIKNTEQNNNLNQEHVDLKGEQFTENLQTPPQNGANETPPQNDTNETPPHNSANVAQPSNIKNPDANASNTSTPQNDTNTSNTSTSQNETNTSNTSTSQNDANASTSQNDANASNTSTPQNDTNTSNTSTSQNDANASNISTSQNDINTSNTSNVNSNDANASDTTVNSTSQNDANETSNTKNLEQIVSEKSYSPRDETNRESTSMSLSVNYKDKANDLIDSNIFNRLGSVLRLRKKAEHEELEKPEEDVKIKDKDQASFFSTRIHWSWIVLILIVCAVLSYMMFRLETIHVEEHKVHIKMAPQQRPFFEDFANSTTKLVEDIIKVDLPSSSSVMDGTVSCRRFANIVEDSPAFKETGSTIARLLRAFSDKIMDAGIALEDMYLKGDMLFWVLNNEISEMMSKLNPNYFDRFFENEDETFFKNRIKDMIYSIDEFLEKVTAARKAIIDAESYRDHAEKKVRQGITEANKFIHNGPSIHEYRLKLNEEEYHLEKIADDKSIDVSNAIDELEHAENTLKLLEKSHEALDLINKILLGYRSKLYNVVAQLDKIKKSKVTKKDIEKLEKLVDTLKISQQKFIGKDTAGGKEKVYV